MRAGELNDAAAITACAEICDALAHAHAAGILHRDVKPSNVLLAETGAKLLDFGLARMQEAETLTAQGDVPGTLAYIAPERLAGDDATGAADVWAIGVMLWESLSGRHPFWHTSMIETARAIEAGAPTLAELRPDLPKALIELVDRALSLSPARRPTAAELAARLRGASQRRRRTKQRGTAVAAAGHAPRLAAAVLAAAFAAGTTVELPFFPHSWTLPLALLAGAAAGLRPRLGLAAALAVPVFPLGNVSLGLALLYAAFAVAWLVLSWREPEGGLLFALGPALAPLAALGLVPLAASTLRAGPRRAAQAAAAVLVAALSGGLRHATLPLAGGRPPLGLGIAGANDPLDVAGTLARALAAHPTLLVEAAGFAAVAFVLPHAQARGRWGAAVAGAGLLLLALPSAQAVSLAVAAWLTAAAVAYRSAHV
jgi:hypothetical protein